MCLTHPLQNRCLSTALKLKKNSTHWHPTSRPHLVYHLLLFFNPRHMGLVLVLGSLMFFMFLCPSGICMHFSHPGCSFFLFSHSASTPSSNDVFFSAFPNHWIRGIALCLPTHHQPPILSLFCAPEETPETAWLKTTFPKRLLVRVCGALKRCERQKTSEELFVL